MEDALSTIIQLAIGGGIATLALWLLTDDDSPANSYTMLDSKDKAPATRIDSWDSRPTKHEARTTEV